MDYDNLHNKIKKLYNEKQECKLKIKLLDREVIKTQYKLSDLCLKNNGKHEWVTEIEDGPYGERFTYCKKCKIDIRGDYFHY